MSPSRIEMAQVHSFRNLSDAQFRPDGIEVAFVTSDSFIDGTPLPRSEILVLDLENGGSTRISAGGISELAPRWAPDSKSLAFLSDVGDTGMLRPFVSRPSESPRPLLRDSVSSTGVVERPRLHTVGTVAPAWSPDGTQIAVLIADQAASEDASGAITRGAHHRLSRAWSVDVSSGDTRPISPQGVNVWEFAWSPNGEAVAAITSLGAEEKDWYEPILSVIDVATGESRDLCTPPEDLAPGQSPIKTTLGRQMALPRWSPDGRQLAFISGSMSDRGLIGGDLYIVDVDGSSPRNLTAGVPASISWYEWESDSQSLIVCAWLEGRQALGRCSSPGRFDLLWSGEVAFADRYQPRFSRSSAGTLALIREDHTHPRELWTFDTSPTAKEQWRQLTNIQPATDQIAFSELRTVTWTTPDGTVCQGHLLRPRNADPDAPLPLVVFPHGGPTFLHQYLFHSRVEGPYALPFELFPANGLSVLLPNMRGSLGWGRPFAEANLGDLGGGDLADTIAGVNHCVDAGLADPNRLGYAGWSSSGLLAALVSCMTTQFKAVMVGAAVVDKRAMRHVNSSFDKLFYPPEPYEAGGAYDRSSPITQVASVSTPTLIIHAFGDQILPAGQALEWQVALEEQGQSPEILIYANEGHAIMGKANQADLAERIVDWFRRALT